MEKMKYILPAPLSSNQTCASKSPNGFSILEAMLAIGILSIVSFAFLGWTSMYNKGITQMAENTEISNAMIKLMSAFGDDDRFCTEIMKNVSLSATGAGTVNEIYFYNIVNGGNPTRSTNPPLMSRGKALSPRTGVIVKEISLVPSVQLDPNIIVADLEVTFSKPPADRPTEVVRSIPIYATVQGGQVIKCSISPANPQIVNQRTCEVKYDGYAFFAPTTDIQDPAQKNPRTNDFCKDAPGILWVKGTTPTSAACGGGYRVAASPLREGAESFACNASTGEGTPIPPRTYFNIGTVSESYDPYVANLSVPTSTCTFAFVAGVDQSTYMSEIKCIATQ